MNFSAFEKGTLNQHASVIALEVWDAQFETELYVNPWYLNFLRTEHKKQGNVSLKSKEPSHFLTILSHAISLQGDCS